VGKEGKKEGGKATWIGHILLRNSLVKYVIEGKIEGRKGRGLRRKQLLDDVKATRNYCKLTEEAPDRIF
jgi:hypothetical protein